MASAVQICNLALAMIGSRSTISSLSEESVEAQQCGLFYALSLDAILEGFDWPFARRKATLAQVGTPPTDWVYQYAYPNDCLAVREVIRLARELDPIPYTIHFDSEQNTRVILSDEADLVIRYTAKVPNEAVLSPLFVKALAAHLAIELTIPLTRDMKLLSTINERYVMAIRDAWAGAASESDPDEERTASWIEGR